MVSDFWSYRTSIVDSSGSGKINTLPNIIKQQNDNDCNIDKIYLNVQGLSEAKYQYNSKKYEKFILKTINIQKFLLNIQIICRVSMETLQSTT